MQRMSSFNLIRRTFWIFPIPRLPWRPLLGIIPASRRDGRMVAYRSKKYFIDIIETKPSNAISIIDTDCEVDFPPPLDYKEPEKPVPISQGKAFMQGPDRRGAWLGDP